MSNETLQTTLDFTESKLSEMDDVLRNTLQDKATAQSKLQVGGYWFEDSAFLSNQGSPVVSADHNKVPCAVKRPSILSIFLWTNEGK